MLLMRKAAVRQMKLTDMFVRAAAGKDNVVKIKEADALNKSDILVPGTSSYEVKENLPVAHVDGSTNGESEPAAKRIKSSEDAVHCSFSERLIGTLQDGTWLKLLMPEFNQKYMREIFGFLEKKEKMGTKIFPPLDLIFNAFNLTPFDQIRVVLIGQDPYHNDHQAHGLCFSVPQGVRPPPSLQNMYKELAKEIPDFKHPGHGCLVGWAKQGVFMLNATLTVEAHKANSHSDIGWQKFTDAVIKIVSEQSDGVVFLLWGAFAQKKECLVDLKKHKVVKSAHPSPLSYTKFKDSRSFIRTNEALIALGREPINWCLL
ncbi:uracil DNA glycosylase superfamily domain-containing protein [Ditylenchus destructor]|uniref:Uracil-DNA glycosylase n=1 Tax=Ditylenchus destructor TaxID=166010 RepID=A0AAD4NIG5_9BILA|nr:uracil DNA glycosylase superfamily domain-containing protein [Ditylenchus destructor]